MRIMQHEEGRQTLVVGRGSKLGGSTQEGYVRGVEAAERELGIAY
jgi:hypothetical protein